MKKLFVTLLLCFSILCQGRSQSLAECHWPERYVDWFSYNQIGIDYMQIWAIAEGVDGYLFAATNDGLAMFDGLRWRHVGETDNLILRALYFDKVSGRLYTAGVNAFGYWVMNSCGDLVYTPLFRNRNTREMSVDFWRIVSRPNSNTIYFQSHSTLYKYNTATGASAELTTPPGEIDFCLGSGDAVWLQAGGVLYAVGEDDRLEPLCEVSGRVVAVVQRDHTPILAIEHAGLFRFEEGVLSPVSESLNERLAAAKINCALPFRGGYIVGTTRAGLVVVDADWSVVDVRGPNIRTQTILTLCVDGRQNIWLGTNSGVARIDFGSNERLIASEQFGQVVSVLPLGEGMLAATNKGVFRVVNGGVEPVVGTQGASWKLVQIDQNLFLLHDRGLFRYVGGRFELVKSGGITDIVQMEGRKEYWVACNYNGLSLYRYDDGMLNFVTKIKGYDSYPMNLRIDRSDNLWLSVTGFGFRRLRLDDNRASVASSCDYKIDFKDKAAGRSVFIGQLNGEHVFYANNESYQYDLMSDSLELDSKTTALLNVCGRDLLTIEQHGNRIWYISRDDIGFLELVSGSVVKHSGIFEQSRKGRVSPRISSVNDDVVIGFNNHIGCVPGNSPNYRAQRIQMGRVEAFGIDKSVTYDRREGVFRIPHSMNNLMLYPVQMARGTKVDYRIIGVDKGWNTLKVTDQIRISAIPSGGYTIEFRPSGVEDSTKYASVKVDVGWPWYVTRLAIGLYVLIFLSVLAGVRSYYIRSNRRQQGLLRARQQEKLEREKLVRDKQIAELHKEQIKIELREKDKRLANITMNSIKRNNILNELKADVLDVQSSDTPAAARQRASKIVRKINTQLANEDDWKQSERYFNTIYDGLLDRLRQRYPSLTKTDLKLCVYIKLNHTTKEIAELMSISPRSIEMARYRLRKKLGLQPTEPIENVLK